MSKRYPFLDYEMPLYVAHKDGWERDERRLYGGDAVLTELVQWTGETDTLYAVRKAEAGYLPFPKIHASTLTGHLSGETPMPEFGQLGKVRERGQIDTPTLAELLWYNVDGVGQDGSEMIPWFDGVQERALATGYRWVMVEKPTRASLDGIRTRRQIALDAASVTMREILDGFRPFPVEYSPLDVPFFQKSDGRLDFAVVRIPITPDTLVDEGFNLTGSTKGYYLLVRRGFQGLGADWAEGGWWKFDPDHELLSNGTWDQTDGQIPMFQFLGEPSTGTVARPAIARSLTMEVGQIAVSLMNRMSERNYNASQSAKSINWILGITPDKHAETISQLSDGSIVVGVPPVTASDGSIVIPTLWNSSAALIDSQAFQSIITAGIEEAHEIMVRQVTSTPDSSGASKQAGFAEATSPLLARLAATRQQAINSFLYFAAQRFGIPKPTASVTIPREFELTPLVDDIDAQIATIQKAGVKSATWMNHLVVSAGEERGLLPDGKRAQIEAEMNANAAADAQAEQQAQSLQSAFDAQRGPVAA